MLVANWFTTLATGTPWREAHAFNGAWLRYAVHVHAYVALLADPYPSFGPDADYPVDLELPEPAPQRRWSVLLRLPLALPAIALGAMLLFGLWDTGSAEAESFVQVGGLLAIVALLGWFAVLARGAMPRGLRDAGRVAALQRADARLPAAADRPLPVQRPDRGRTGGGARAAGVPAAGRAGPGLLAADRPERVVALDPLDPRLARLLPGVVLGAGVEDALVLALDAHLADVLGAPGSARIVDRGRCRGRRSCTGPMPSPAPSRRCRQRHRRGSSSPVAAATGAPFRPMSAVSAVPPLWVESSGSRREDHLRDPAGDLGAEGAQLLAQLADQQQGRRLVGGPVPPA